VTTNGKQFVALLRGINVSGHNPLAMKDLRALVEALPAEDVATYLQSGNVVFTCTESDPDVLAEALTTRIREAKGLEVTVLVLPAAELGRVADANPFLDGEGDHSRLYVTFLATSPDPTRVAALEQVADAAAPDSFRLGSDAVYLSCPNGYGRTKLNNALFEKKLGVAATTRNWRTVTALIEMTQ
jgi:uncharacterized protein (DUF1697 family)